MGESFANLILRMTRTFDAAPERVFAAWTNPEQFGQWFGPVGMKTVDCAIDARVGGAWRLMGEGKDIPGREPGAGTVRPTVSGRYLEVEPPKRLVFTWAWHERDDFASPRGQESVVTVLFNAVGDRTEMVFTQAVLKDEEALAAHRRGWTESFDKLGAFVGRAA
ncbi:MAG TPA: SRPBCC domain-containing protein [Reyranella sp.]|nr:SRPBCC domain-containing protein [Reyranella sp.]